VLGPGHFPANLLSDQVPVKIQSANFDGMLGNENTHHVPPLRIEFQRDPGPAAAGGFGAAFSKQPPLNQPADDGSHSVWRLARPFMKLPPAQAPLVPQDLNDFFFPVV
jgi:hypothetical protein